MMIYTIQTTLKLRSMKKFKLKYLVILWVFITMTFMSCKKQKLKNYFSNYIKKENNFYRLDSAIVFYDSISPDKTLYSLGIHSNDEEQNMIVFDNLLLQSTYKLLTGSYIYKNEQRIQNFETDKFHDIILRCKSPVMNSSSHPVTHGSLYISNINHNIYEVKANLIMGGKSYQVQYKGSIQHIKAW